MKKKLLLTSILSIVMCVSLIAGATFALFTSESKVNVAVTSGKVDVVATINNVELYSPTSIGTDGTILDDTNAATETFANSGTVALNGNTIEISNVTPGDKATVTIDVTNNSTVAVKYRTVLTRESDNGLLQGLSVTIEGDDDSFNGIVKVSEWQTISANAEIGSIKIVVELPANTEGNEYQGKTCKISYRVEAVQGNAVTYSASTAAVVFNGDDYTEYTSIAAAASAFVDGSVIKIVKSTDENLRVTNGNNVTYTAEKGVVLSGGVGGSYWNKSVVLDGLTFNGGVGVSLTAQSAVSYTIKNCTFEGVTATAWKQGVISVNGSGSAAPNVTVIGNIIKDVKNCTTGDGRIDTQGQQSNGIHIGSAGEAIITNNVIEDVDGTGIYVATASEAVITGNTVSEWGTGATANNEGRAIRTSNVTSLTITGNKMLDTTSNEEYVKATGTAAGNIDVSKNYWGGNVPNVSGVFSADASVAVVSYYSDSAMTNLVTIND